MCERDVGANMGRAGKLLYEVRMEHDQALRFRLPALGVQTADIAFVIITHLHIDHASAVSEFPQATLPDRPARVGGGGRRRHACRAITSGSSTTPSSGARSTTTARRSSRSPVSGARSTCSATAPCAWSRVPGTRPGTSRSCCAPAHGEVLIAGDAAYTEEELRGRDRPLVVADEHLRRRSIREIGQYRRQTPDAVVILSHDWNHWPRLQAVYE